MKKWLTLFLVFLMIAGTIPALSQEASWTPREAPIIRQGLSEEEIRAAQDEILSQSKLIFSGAVNKSYNGVMGYPLKTAKAEDMIALRWACDDVTHGGWGVLGMTVNSKQININAVSDQPDKERLYLYTVKELMELAGITLPMQFTSFSIGAWNGGRIAGLYHLNGEQAARMQQLMSSVNEMQKIIHTYDGRLSNEHALPQAQAVYAYLQEIWGKGCLTGQMESTWMGSPDYEMNFLEKHTGKLPAIRGLDFMHNDFKGVAKRAAAWWEKGGIPHICWHTGSDFASGYNESKDHNLDWEKALTPGTGEYEKLLKAMDRAVPALQQLQDAGVPVLWRPFHELDGGWFWWSKGGSEHFVRLWQLMYSRYTDYWGLNNLIWVLGYSGNGGNMAAWYPGDEYVDLIGADSYTPGANGHLYQEVASIAPEGMPIVFHECGAIPTEQQMKDASSPWLMFMVWHTSHLTDGLSNTPSSLHAIYNSDYFITLDELPAFQ
ncbi:MAG: hypothetical protein IJD39_03450 [Clostridia bacterium]|nr:hypothetical protein [Clostridia bacterium]